MVHSAGALPRSLCTGALRPAARANRLDPHGLVVFQRRGVPQQRGAERGFTLALSADVAGAAARQRLQALCLQLQRDQLYSHAVGTPPRLALHGASAVTMGNYPYQGSSTWEAFWKLPSFKLHARRITRGPSCCAATRLSRSRATSITCSTPSTASPSSTSTEATPHCRFSWGASAVTSSPTTVARSISSMPKNWTDKFHLGVGGELWVDLTLGYFLSAKFRFGYARHGQT